MIENDQVCKRVSLSAFEVCQARMVCLPYLPYSGDFMEHSPSSPSEGSRWRRMIRPLANCVLGCMTHHDASWRYQKDRLELRCIRAEVSLAGTLNQSCLS